METEKFEKYQEFTEQTIYKLSQQVMQLEKKLDMFTNMLEISKYINQYIKSPNLFPLINDMLIGVFGANHSTIYIKMNNEYYEAAAQTVTNNSIEKEKRLIEQYKEEEFIINSKDPIFSDGSDDGEIHSCIGVPVKIDNRQIGFLLIQHREMGYFTKERAIFLSLIGNHIGVAIENNFLYKQIRDSAAYDGLTDIFNKRHFFETLNLITNLSELDYSIVIVDLDNFKSINDRYGHPMGDVVLKTVAQIIKKGTRSNDIVARYGGDEIIVFIQTFTDADKLRQRIEKIREEIATTEVTHEGISISTTASFGVYIKQDELLSLDDVIKKADEIMYLSKHTGKNKVTIG